MSVIGGGHCLPPDQRVLTEDGYRPVSEVVPGDRLVTGQGRLCTLTQVQCFAVAEPLFHIATVAEHVVRLTGDHLVLAHHGGGVGGWVPARGLKPGDWVAVRGGGTLPRTPRVRPGSGPVATLLEEPALYLSMRWVAVATVDPAPYVGLVYDLSVAGDASFISEGFVLGARGGAESDRR